MNEIKNCVFGWNDSRHTGRMGYFLYDGTGKKSICRGIMNFEEYHSIVYDFLSSESSRVIPFHSLQGLEDKDRISIQSIIDEHNAQDRSFGVWDDPSWKNYWDR